MNNIQDPAVVVSSAITNAISIAGIIATCKGVITIPPEIKEEMRRMAERMNPNSR